MQIEGIAYSRCTFVVRIWRAGQRRRLHISSTSRERHSVSTCHEKQKSATLATGLAVDRAAREGEPHQHEGGGDLAAADQDAGRRLHLVPFIGAVGPVPAAFAKMLDDAAERGDKG